MKTYLKNWVQYVDIPVETLANESGLSEETIDQLLDGTKEPTLSQLTVLSNILNVSIDDILHRHPYLIKDRCQFRDYFKFFCHVKGFMPADISEETGIDENIIKSWLDGARDPSLDDILKLSEALHVSIDELFGQSSNELLLNALRKTPGNQFIYQTDVFKVANRMHEFMLINNIRHIPYIVRVNGTISYFMIIYYAKAPMTPNEISKIVRKIKTPSVKEKECSKYYGEKFDGFECIDRSI